MGAKLAIVTTLPKQVLRMGLLEVAAADFGERDLRGNRQHGCPAAVGIEQAIDEMKIAGTAAGHPCRRLPRIPSAEIGGGYFQETHPQNLFRECSHYCELVSDPAQLPYVLENAIRAAVGQRGVAVLVIPGDVALRPAPKRAISPIAGLLPAPPVVRPAEREVTDLADLLNGARRVTLVLRTRLRGRP